MQLRGVNDLLDADGLPVAVGEPALALVFVREGRVVPQILNDGGGHGGMTLSRGRRRASKVLGEGLAVVRRHGGVARMAETRRRGEDAQAMRRET